MIPDKTINSLVGGNGYAGDVCIACPYCRGDYTHICSVGTLLGTDACEASVYSGTSVIGRTTSRRSALQITLTCELCPKPFDIVIQQHKGVNSIEVRTR